MLSIGEIAHRTGVSRRMLRHWESEGLLAPVDVDPVTGYRRYQSSQLGRVKAIAELRDLGFGLDEIHHLLDPQIAQTVLVRLLTERTTALQEQIVEASTRLGQIQERLDDIQHKSQEIGMNLSLEPLPALTLWGATTRVLDETEIGQAVAALRLQLPHTHDDLVLLFDGTRHDLIMVSAGIMEQTQEAALDELRIPAADHGVCVRFDKPPANLADVWVLIDAELEAQHLASTGSYRQVIGMNGETTLLAPIHHVD